MAEEEPEFEWYHEFIDESHAPNADELLVVFKAKPSHGFTFKDIAGRVASESSIGTWTTLATLDENIRSLMAKAYYLDEDEGIIKVAYPIELFELGNISQLFSSVMGNIFGMKAVKNLRVLDIRFPREYIESFKGPLFGIDGVKNILKVYDRPILATVPKPKVGLDSEKYARVAYEIALGGIDLVKDDENLTSQNFNKFEKRLELVMKAIEKAEKETGERKGYLVNVTSDPREMERRIKLVADYNNRFFMLDILCVGPAAMQMARDLAEDYKLAIHAHRAFHAAFTRNKDHGVSFFVIAKIARLVGVDHIHIGTNVGKMEADLKALRDIQRVITENKFTPETGDRVLEPQEWFGVKPVFPVASGGLHPGILPDLLKFMGKDLIIQVGGGVTGHPDGVVAGGRAVRQAIEAYLKGIPLEEYGKTHRELARALEKWKFVRPA